MRHQPQQDRPVATQFNPCMHSMHNVQVPVPEKVQGQSKSLRVIRESKYINYLNNKFSSGFNLIEVRQM